MPYPYDDTEPYRKMLAAAEMKAGAPNQIAGVAPARKVSAIESWDPSKNPPAPSTIERGRRGSAAPVGITAPPQQPMHRAGRGAIPMPVKTFPSLIQDANAAPVQKLPVAPQKITGAAPAPQQPMHRAGRGAIPMPVVNTGTNSGPRFTQGPPGSGGGGRGRVTAQPMPAASPSLIPDANAATAPAPTPTIAPPITPTTPLDPSGQFRPLDGAAASAVLDSDNAGSAVMQGRFLRPDGTRGPQETRAYTQGGAADAAKRVNVMPFAGLLDMMVDPGGQTASALSDARRAAADRGDFEAVERSYLTTPEQKAEYDAGKAEAAILKRLPRLRGEDLSQALAGLADLRASRAATAPSFDQIKADRATQLLNGQPPGSDGADRLIFGGRSSTKRRIVEDAVLGADGFPTGEKRFYSVDPETGESVPVDVSGGKSAQGGVRPKDHPDDAYQGLKPDGTPGWFVKREGKTYLVSQ